MSLPLAEQQAIDRKAAGSGTPVDTQATPQPQGLSKQSFKAYRDFTMINVHQVMTDCLTGRGGCACQAGDDYSYSWETLSQSGKIYTYIRYNASELQFGDRVAASMYVNHSEKYCTAITAPIWLQGSIENTLKKGDTDIDISSPLSHGLNESLKRVDGIQKSYSDYQQETSLWWAANGVVYHLMSKGKDDKIRLVYRRAIDVLFEPKKNRDTFELEEIFFFDSSEIIDNQEYLFGTLHRMNGSGFYEKVKYKADSSSEWKTSLENWEEVETITTTSRRMLVFAQVEPGHPTGTYLPSNPRAYNVARLSLGIMNMLSVLLWQQKVDGHALLYVYGDIIGLNRNIGSLLKMTMGADGTAPPAPGKVESNPQTIISGLTLLQFVLSQLKEVMKQYGVNVTESDSAQAQTAESKSYDYQATNQALNNTKAKFCLPLDDWYVNTYMYLTGNNDAVKNLWELTREYPSDFFPEPEETVDELIEIANFAKTDGLVKTYIQACRQLANKISGELQQSDRQEITDEIEEVGESMRGDDNSTPPTEEDVEDTEE